MSACVSVERVPFDDAEVQALLQAMGVEIIERYSGDIGVDEADENYPPVTTADFDPPRGVFLLARLDGLAVGCGGVRTYGDGVGEVKRMFVATEVRGRGIAGALLAALEDEAHALGFRSLVLETGTRQPEAMAVYERGGWHAITPYGEYRSSSLSRCYAKDL